MTDSPDKAGKAERSPHPFSPFWRSETSALAWRTGELQANIREAIDRISKAKPGDVQEIAGSQIELLTSYYRLVLDQAKKSFRWALIMAGVGSAFFIAAVFFILYWNAGNAAYISAVGGAMVEVIAGLNFSVGAKFPYLF